MQLGVQELLARLPVRRLVVVELDVRLRVERDEKVEREISVRAASEGKDRAPVVELPLQRYGMIRELVRLEIEAPEGEPFVLWAEVVEAAFEIGFAVRFTSMTDDDELRLGRFIVASLARA